MKSTKFIACLLASLMLCGAFTACGDDDSSSKAKESSESSEASEESKESEADSDKDNEGADESSVEGQLSETPDFEEAIAAESGDAYLAIVDGEWYVQYWGANTDLLTYDAGVVPITGDGEYTVSVNAATAGLMYDVTGDANGDYTPSGLEFLAVMVKDGTTLYPNMSIEVTGVKVNGTEVPMSAKNYTSSDDGVEMRANLYNHYVEELPEDAHDANGAVTDNTAYSAQIVDPAAFADGWTSVEVTFNVTGIDG